MVPERDKPENRLRVDLAYVGSGFHGWQEQTPDLRTVQGELRAGISRVIDADISIVGAGRTDAGVHARGQVCHFGVDSSDHAARVIRALPGLVPADIQIHSVRRVSPDFDARFSARSRRYSYRLRLHRDIFDSYSLFVRWPLNRSAMDRAAEFMLGQHDCTSFCKKSSLKPDDNTCLIDLCAFDWADDSAIFHIRANRFLHNMVRSLVGTLLEIGRGARAPEEMAGIVAARDRGRAAATAPAHGLCLEEVVYPAELDDPAYRLPGQTTRGNRPALPASGSREGDDA